MAWRIDSDSRVAADGCRVASSLSASVLGLTGISDAYIQVIGSAAGTFSPLTVPDVSNDPPKGRPTTHPAQGTSPAAPGANCVLPSDDRCLSAYRLVNSAEPVIAQLTQIGLSGLFPVDQANRVEVEAR